MKFATSIKLGNKQAGAGHSPLMVAELSGNHNQSLELALQMVDAAADAGADAIKLQSYTPDSMTLDMHGPGFDIEDPAGLWKGETLYGLYQKACTPYEWHEPLFRRASERGLLAFSSPFDEQAVDFLETLNCPCYKIASFENNHLALIKHAAKTGKPLIISCGMASMAELSELVEAVKSAGCNDLILLKCTSAYPSPPEAANLRTMVHLNETFGALTGLSDHTTGIACSVAAVALGACMIEKHFILDRSAGGVDVAFSLEPKEFQLMVQEAREAWLALGFVCYGDVEREQAYKDYRRSIYISQDVKAGDMVTEANIRIIRPGFGLPPKDYALLLGRRFNRDAPKGTPMSWDLI